MVPTISRSHRFVTKMDKIVFQSNNFVNIIFLFALYPLYTNQGIWKSEIVCYFCFSDFSKVVIFLLSIIFLVFLELIGNLTHLALRYHKKGKHFVNWEHFYFSSCGCSGRTCYYIDKNWFAFFLPHVFSLPETTSRCNVSCDCFSLNRLLNLVSHSTDKI